MSLPEHTDDAGCEGCGEKNGGGEQQAVAADELDCAVTEGAAARFYGTAIEEGLDVGGELVGGLITFLRLLAQRL
jgi:hypothetical protein